MLPSDFLMSYATSHIEGSLDLYYILINFPGDSQETDHRPQT